MTSRDIISALRVKLANKNACHISIGRKLAEAIVSEMEQRRKEIKTLLTEVERLNLENERLSGWILVEDTRNDSER